MGKHHLICLLAAAFALSGCLDSGDTRNAAIGASVGAVGSAVTDGDPVTGALLGATAGALCDDVGICN